MTGWAGERESDLGSLKGIELVTDERIKMHSGSLAAQRQQNLTVERWQGFQRRIFCSMGAMDSADRKSSMDILGGNHENDYLRAKCAYLK